MMVTSTHCRRPLRLYKFAFRALLTGLLMVASNVSNAQQGGGYANAGLQGEYFANDTLTGAPTFMRRDVRLNFVPESARSWAGSRSGTFASFPSSSFSVRWTGTILPRFSETYTFKTLADDGARVFIRPEGGSTWTTLVDDWPSGGQGATWSIPGTDGPGTFAMSAGSRYEIRVEYRNLSGNGALRLVWSSPSTPEEVIEPAAALSINWNTYAEQMWADAFLAGRNGWEGTNGNPAPAMDSNGWPLGDCAFIVSETLTPHDLSPFETGDMALTLTGKADILSFGNCSIVSQSYNAGTNTTSAVVRGVDNNGNVLMLHFRNTDRDGQAGGDAGFTDLKCMRLPYAGAPAALPTDALFHPKFLEAFERVTALRYQRNNDQAREWADRSFPNMAFPEKSNPFVYRDRYGYDLSGSTRLAHEYEIMLCNELGTDYYLSIPHLATYEGAGNYVRNLALLIRYGSDQNGNPYTSPQASPYHPPLNPNLNVYFEIGNELWNFAQLQAYPCFFDLHEEVVDLYNSGDPDFDILNYDNASVGVDANGRPNNLYTLVRRWWGLRLMHMSNEFRAVFGDGEMPGNGNTQPRIRPYFTWQYGDANATASTGLKFMDNYFNNADGQSHVATPRPPSYYFWCGGGAGYYSVTNRDGHVDPNPVSNHGFESPTVTGSVLRPGNAGWTFTGTAGIAADASRTSVVTTANAASVTNTSGGWRGMKFTVGSSPVTIYELGRWVISGNSENHDVKIVRASDGVEVATARVSTSAVPAGAFVYASCAPVMLAANTTYYLLSQETAGGDTYGGASSGVSSTGAVTFQGAASATNDSGWSFTDEGSAGTSYGPVSFKYASTILLASGTPLNNPDVVEGSQTAWIQTVNGVSGRLEATFALPVQQTDDTYSFNLRWMRRHQTLASQGDAINFRCYAIVNGNTIDITPRENNTQPQNWRADWRRIAYWVGDWYWTNVFHAPAGANVTLRIEADNASGDLVGFIDEVILTSVDAFYSDMDLGAGTAAGQPSTGYGSNQFNDGKWASAYGLVQMTYEHGFSAGGDAGNSALQNYCKFRSGTAKQTVIDALDAFQRSGGRTPTFGTYSTWPAFEAIDGVREEGTADAASYPLTEGMDVVLDRLPLQPTNGELVPAIVDGESYTLDYDQAGNGAAIGTGDWRTYNFVVTQPGTYSVGANLTGAGQVEISMGGTEIVATGSGDGLVGGSVYLPYGRHAVRVRGLSGSATIEQVMVDNATQAPAQPASISATINADTSISITWSDSSSGSSQELWFELERSTTADFSASVVDLGQQAADTSSYTDLAQLPVDTTYYYRVRSVNLNGASSWRVLTGGLYFPVPAPSNVLFAYDPLDVAPQPLHNTSTGSGWAGSWTVQNSDTVTPGWEVRNASPLSWTDLITQGSSYAVGGRAYLGCGRVIDTTGFPYYYKKTDGQIGADGTVVWVSALLRADRTNIGGEFLMFSTSTNVAVTNDILGGLDVNNGTWSLMMKDAAGTKQYVDSSKSVTAGEVILAVIKMEFGAQDTLSLYLNPTGLGGAAPSTPDATISTNGDLRFRTLLFKPDNGSDAGSIDEVRIGDSYAAVTPTNDTQPVIATTSLANATEGLAYTANFVATGGDGTLSWAIVSGSLPTGLSLSGSGLLSGTPTSAGTSSFTVQVSDADGDTDSLSLDLTVEATQPPVEGIFAEDSFGSTAGSLHGLATGSGWAEAWQVQGADVTVPGFEVRTSSPVNGGSGYIVGGNAYKTAGRGIDMVSVPSELVDANNRIGADGQSVWVSASVRADRTNINGRFLSLIRDSCYYCGDQQVAGILVQNGQWALRAKDATGTDVIVSTGISVVAGEVVVVVLEVSYGATQDTVRLYLNPTSPTAADAEVISDGSIAFTRLGFAPDNGPDGGSMDDLKLGTSFAAVTGITPDLQPSITTTALPDGEENISYSAALAADSGDGSLTWSIVSGSLPGGLTLSSAGLISGTPTVAGTFNFSVQVADADNDTDTAALSIVIAAAPPPPPSGLTNTLDRDYWTGISGTNISDLTGNVNFPDSPSGVDQLGSGFEALGWVGSSNEGGSPNWGDNYGQRIYGYLVPEVSGDYIFWISGDDDCDLYLSTDSDPANAVRIAYVDGWTSYKEWGKYSSQKSASVSLLAGEVYYIEAIHKEGNGGDSCTVGWAKPGESTTAPSEVVPASVLSSYYGGVPTQESWVGQDIGSVAQAGSLSYDSATDTFVVDGSGSDIWGTADEFHYVTLEDGLTGDGLIQARVVSMDNTNDWAKAGVMIRDGLSANAAHASTVLTPANGVAFQRRLVAGGSSSNNNVSGSAPLWIRIVRAGDAFTSFWSSDGQSWTQIGSAVTITMGSNVQIGLCVTSHSDGVLCTTTFDNVSVE